MHISRIATTGKRSFDRINIPCTRVPLNTYTKRERERAGISIDFGIAQQLDAVAVAAAAWKRF